MIDATELPTLRGQRLQLRWLRDDDVEGIYDIFRSEEVTRYWSWPAYTRPGQAADLLATIRDYFQKHELYQWGVARLEDDQIIGVCTLAHLSAQNRRAEVGFALNREHWGGGWMSEAVGVLLEYAFGPLNLHRLEADVDPLNEGSIRLLERAGFIKEGLMRERWIIAGKTSDSVYYGLLAREWKQRRGEAAMD